jgi:hypothetical protein
MKKAFVSVKRQSRSIETPAFTRIFDEAYRNHYTNIKIKIERFAAHRTPLEYTQRHTPDITNLYYYIDTPRMALLSKAHFRRSLYKQTRF